MKADVKRAAHAEKLIAVIRALGVDKHMQPRSISTKALAEKTGIAASSIQASLEAALKRGDVVACKVIPASGHAYNEWRVGPGMPPPEFRPLNPKKAGAPLGRPAHRGGSAPAVSLSTSKPGVTETHVPTLGQAQPAVAKNTGSSAIGMSPTTPSPEVPAVAAQATPGPTPHAALNKEPAARKAPAGDVMHLRIDEDGTVLIATDESLIELDPKQSRRLGNFMLGSQSIWNPF